MRDIWRVVRLVESISPLAFSLWVEGQRDRERNGAPPRVYHAQDDCKCPLAQWLTALAGPDVTEEISVGDDSVSDGADFVASLPRWARAFVNDFDETCAGVCTTPELLAYLKSAQPTLERLDGEE